MNRTRFAVVMLTTFVLMTSGCDTGLGPLNEASGITGVVHIKNWPRQDSVLNLRVVALTAIPRLSGGITPGTYLLIEWANGRGSFYPPGFTGKGLLDSLNANRYGVDTSLRFTFTDLGSNLRVGEYAYIAVAQQYGPDVFNQWKVAGLYVIPPDTLNPAPVRVLLHRLTPNVDITVDFHNPPPQPW